MRRMKLGVLVLLLVVWAGCRDSTGPPPERDEKGPDEPRKEAVLDSAAAAIAPIPD